MIRFGPAGVPLSSPSPSTKDGIITCAKLGLKAMEVEFVHGVKIQLSAAKECYSIARDLDIKLSIHAPYYINLCSPKQYVLKNSFRHISQSIEVGHYLKAKPIVIHSGFYLNQSSETCTKLIKQQYKNLIDYAKNNNFEFLLGPELTGKNSAYGTLEELTELASFFGIEQLIPVLDFAHYHARISRLKTKDDYKKILDFCEKKLGQEFSKNLHIHFSGIEYSDKGEKKHLPVSSNSPPYKPLLEVLKEGGYGGVVICESPLLEKDALILQKQYEKI
ncbi:MAG: TIM barrel protein [Candidatus Micrarchaeota archaeon]|nr:TIM barrel protein [Candidatus Micrarchaeota archaeon]